jgi:hypothetical protein
MAVKFFNMLLTLAIFVILGIGADDIFIFLDGWRQSAVVDSKIAATFESRMLWVYGRAAKAMFITSLTTSAAFYANAISIIPPIRNFGIFSGTMVLINYVLVITWFPAVVIVYSQYIEKRDYLCRLKEAAPEETTLESMESQPEKQNDGATNENGETTEQNWEDEQPDLEKEKFGIENYRKLEKFFYYYYAPGLYKSRYVVLAGFGVLLALSIYAASQLEPADEPARFLPTDHPIQIALEISTQELKRVDGAVQVVLYWGIEGVDTSGRDPNDATDLGELIWDDTFYFFDKVQQDFFLDTCQELRKQTQYVRELYCFLEDFYVFTNGTVPPPNEMLDNLQNFTEQFPFPKQTSVSFDSDLEQFDYTSTVRFDEITGQLRYVAMVANLTLPPRDPVQTARPYLDFMNDFIDERNAVAPTGMTNGLQTSPRWPRLITEDVLLSTAISGVILSLCLAFIIILFSTYNWILTILAMIGVIGTVVSFMAFMVGAGWQLGIIESVSITILVGLSVDYVVHIANSCNESKLTGRFERGRQGLTDMGISVFSASITTIGAGVCLLFTIVIFFVRFGMFILMTILGSTVYSFGFFMAAFFIVGPKSRRQGNLAIYFRRLKAKFEK